VQVEAYGVNSKNSVNEEGKELSAAVVGGDNTHLCCEGCVRQ